MAVVRLTPLQVFLTKWRIDIGTGCWVWQGILTWKGYGEFKSEGRKFAAHRWAYQTYVGVIPHGLQIDHLCRNRACVNPGHMELVTPRENTLRGFGPSALNARKTHCKWGHPFDEANTRYVKRGRECFECKRRSDRIRRLEKRLARQAVVV